MQLALASPSEAQGFYGLRCGLVGRCWKDAKRSPVVGYHPQKPQRSSVQASPRYLIDHGLHPRQTLSSFDSNNSLEYLFESSISARRACAPFLPLMLRPFCFFSPNFLPRKHPFTSEPLHVCGRTLRNRVPRCLGKITSSDTRSLSLRGNGKSLLSTFTYLAQDAARFTVTSLSTRCCVFVLRERGAFTLLDSGQLFTSSSALLSYKHNCNHVRPPRSPDRLRSSCWESRYRHR
jgi:hypothetical protein